MGRIRASADLAYVRRVLRERWWLIVAVTVGCALIGGAFEWRSRVEFYEASATILIRPLTPDATFIGLRTLRLPEDADLTAREAAQFVSSPRVTRRAQRILGTKRRFAATVGAAPSGENGALAVGGRSTDAHEAARVANAFATALAAQYRAFALARFEVIARTFIRQRRAIDAGPSDGLAALRRRVLNAQAASLRTVRQVATPAQVVERAAPPDEKDTLRVHQTLPAALLGFSLAVVAAFVGDGLRRRPSDPGRLADVAELEVAGWVPTPERVEPADWDSAFDRLHDRVQHLAEGRSGATVLVAGVGVGEEPTTVALGLAESAERAGAGEDIRFSAGPALLTSADTLRAARSASVVLLCATVGTTDAAELRDAAALLRASSPAVTALVLCGTSLEPKPLGRARQAVAG